MISSLCWVPKGASKVVPVVAEPPSKEEIEEVLRTGVLERSRDSEEEDDDDMDVDDATKEEDEVIHARAAAKALNQNRRLKDSSDVHAVADGFEELNMDAYDDEDDGLELFSSGLGDAYYPSNDMDPYLQNKDDEDEDDDEIEDMTIKPTDSVIICARNEDEVNHLEVWIVEDSIDGDVNMYVHHDIILPAFPLCTAWLDCNHKSGDKGNFVAVGTMEPAIEIWDLDLIDEVEPFLVLGGVSKKKKKEKKKSVVYRKDSHRDSVLGLAWNREVRNVLASASADKSVKIWDLGTGKCVATVRHHEDKVQSVAWNRQHHQLLLTGSFDKSVALLDADSITKVSNKWQVLADVESLAWDPHVDHSFIVSQENGTVQGFDVRTASSDSSGGKPLFTLQAHEKAISSISYNPSVPSYSFTGSTDKMVKLWDLSNNQPSCVASKNLKAGSIFSIAFSEDSPFLLAAGGHKGKLKVWDMTSEPEVARKFDKYTKLRKDSATAL
ncbi:Protein SPA1-like 2 [Apostasia shenzhenica]|uniref:Protein SPA1-like 2 n=1 Tax=Apostasia shenzhenica TaxID=1088818 RepID=A0A2I0AMD7_9ASPA|nr:Protein SPA1-like 2 [Apostasia shenzhenica]